MKVCLHYVKQYSFHFDEFLIAASELTYSEFESNLSFSKAIGKSEETETKNVVLEEFKSDESGIQ